MSDFMVKEIRIVLDDIEHQKLKDAKGDKTYKEYLLEKSAAVVSDIQNDKKEKE